MYNCDRAVNIDMDNNNTNDCDNDRYNNNNKTYKILEWIFVRTLVAL